MKLRLASKVWGTFTLTVLLVVCVPFAVTILRGSTERDTQRRLERLHAAATIHAFAGERALSEVTRYWPESDRAELRRELAEGPAERTLPPLPSGRTTRLWLIAIQVLVGLFVSAAFAYYFVRPLITLRKGFERISRGDLDTRLTPEIGRRRDEIADIARDFDIMAERLQRTLLNRDRLLHDVSHELRSPLARLSATISLVEPGGTLSPRNYERIAAECERLDTIIGDLVGLSRAEGKGATDEIFFDPADLLNLVAEDVRYEAAPRDVTLRLTTDEQMKDPATAPVLHGSPELFRRAVENVARNALRFSPAGKVIELNAGVEARDIVIHIRDHGPGVPAAMLDAMFDPFVKGSSDGDGVGLGLSIARRALATFDGELQAVNHPLGGLDVTMRLPIALEQFARSQSGG